MKHDEASILREHEINPSAQRIAVARYVLHTDKHPSADEVWTKVKKRFPHISRATVYNTLNLFVEKGLLREFVLTEGRMVFDPRLAPHHHFIDDESGDIHDIAWDKVKVSNVGKLDGFDVSEYQVVLRGRKTGKG